MPRLSRAPKLEVVSAECRWKSPTEKSDNSVSRDLGEHQMADRGRTWVWQLRSCCLS